MEEQSKITSDINKGSQLLPGFTWSVYIMERAGVPNVLYTQVTILETDNQTWSYKSITHVNPRSVSHNLTHHLIPSPSDVCQRRQVEQLQEDRLYVMAGMEEKKQSQMCG